jgi:fibro-slime domain-containing protein
MARAHAARPRSVGGALSLAWLAVGCGARTELELGSPCERLGATRPCASICGAGVETCIDGFWSECSAPLPGPTIGLTGVVRDFRTSHPDFETTIGDDRGIVEPWLGDDGKPVYAGEPTTLTTHGKDRFDEWYRDVPGVNLRTEHTIVLQRVGGGEPRYQVSLPAFFPIDGQLFGNQGNSHNFHFTFELATEFRYVGGEIFTFTGDDDLWAFIAGRLAIDLGGIHSAETASVSVDAVALELGLERGAIVPLSLFFAERHTTESSFAIDTTIVEFRVCPGEG